MARVVETHWPGALSGCVVTQDATGHGCQRIDVLESAHPVPDARSVAAAQRLLATVAGLTADDLVVALISGGGSSLLCLPGEGLDLAGKQAINRALLACGASIDEMNVVRRHLSGIKGGRLAAGCHPARLLSLIISDVPGDNLADIASGPTVADTSTCADALAVITRYGITLPAAAKRLLDGAGETIKPGDPRIARAEARIIAQPRMALNAAANAARQSGIATLVLGDRIEGEAREVARVMAGIALSCASAGEPLPRPCLLLSGGETTVTVRGSGTGGRNVEFLLALALALRGAPGIHALAADTDGIDGGAPVAGAVIGPDTLARARILGLDARDHLDRNDAHSFFAALGDQIVPGPTSTNVNDFRAVLVL